MFPTLQPSRPKLHEPTSRRPLHQQQTRNTSALPRTQIEAMPPHRAPIEQPTLPLTQFNPALMHPVFFTENWRKPPFQMPLTTGFSPVATGYVFGDKKRKDTLTKL